MTRREYRRLLVWVGLTVFLGAMGLGILPPVWRILPAAVVGVMVATGWCAASTVTVRSR